MYTYSGTFLKSKLSTSKARHVGLDRVTKIVIHIGKNIKHSIKLSQVRLSDLGKKRVKRKVIRKGKMWHRNEGRERCTYVCLTHQIYLNYIVYCAEVLAADKIRTLIRKWARTESSCRIMSSSPILTARMRDRGDHERLTISINKIISLERTHFFGTHSQHSRSITRSVINI